MERGNKGVRIIGGNKMTVFLYVLVGLLAGISSGLLGIGGGTIMIPAMVYIWNFTQHQAQGTTLALMVLPIGLLAAYKYYLSGDVDLTVVLYMAIGFFIGGFIGASFAQPIPDILLKRLFGIFLLFVALRMIILK
jgi:hypothetical protein